MRPDDHPFLRALATLALASQLAACAGPFATNASFERWQPGEGYRAHRRWSAERSPELMVVLAFSGGGTRAAAFSYGILEELAEVTVELEGRRVPLLEEIDHISSVSGGSFTAAYYGLHGRGIFDDFEQRFLYRDLQGELVRRVLRPWVWVPLLSTHYNRSDLAASLYHETLFDGARFADLERKGAPLIQINATDLATGSPFSFLQEQFDFLCSPLDEYPIAAAVAASSAVPGLLSPVPLENFGGHCDHELPSWVQRELAGQPSFERTYINARNLASYSSDRRSKIRLIDGAMSDNLGVRGPFESTTFQRPESADEPNPRGPLRHMLFVLVNADTAPSSLWRAFEETPSIATIIQSTSGAQITRYNLETIELLRAAFDEWNEVANRWAEPMHFYLVEVDFMRVPDEEERRVLNELPTTLTLAPEDVRRVRRAAREVLRASPEYQRFLEATRGREPLQDRAP